MLNSYANDKLNDNIKRDDEDPLLPSQQRKKKPQRKLRSTYRRQQRRYVYLGVIVTLALVAICLVIYTEISAPTINYQTTIKPTSPSLTSTAPANNAAHAKSSPEIMPTQPPPTPPLPPPSTPSPNKTKTILLWNANTFPISILIGKNHCTITSQHNYQGSDSSLDKYDAIVFDVAATNFSYYQDNNRDLLSMPRNPHQNYIYFQKEPPVNRAQLLTAQSESYFYNLTMSYNLHSDIVLERFKVSKKLVDDNSTYDAPTLHPSWMQPPTTMDYYKNDSSLYAMKSIAARVDLNEPCNGAKNQLIEEFQEHMIVDVYGNCGEVQFCTLNCKNYYFYLALENIHCTDYISSGFYIALKNNMVPVVFGGANYTLFAPPHSYINAKDYNSVRELVEYLAYLIDSPVEYMKYFWWQNVYEFIKQKESWSYRNLCKFLHENNKTSNDISNWWQYNVCQMDAKISE